MKKKFDAVVFQRKARAELSRKYRSDRRAFLRELKEKYGSSREAKTAHQS